MKGIDISEVVEFVSSMDKSENPTRFLIGNITYAQKMGLMGILGEDGKPNVRELQKKLPDIVKAGLKGIKGLEDKNGLQKDYSAIDDSVLEMIPIEALVEVAGEIIKHNFLSAGERKN